MHTRSLGSLAGDKGPSKAGGRRHSERPIGRHPPHALRWTASCGREERPQIPSNTETKLAGGTARHMAGTSNIGGQVCWPGRNRSRQELIAFCLSRLGTVNCAAPGRRAFSVRACPERRRVRSRAALAAPRHFGAEVGRRML